MRAYYYAETPSDPRTPHLPSSATPSPDLAALNIQHHRLSSTSSVDALAESRGYKNRDVVTISPEALGGADAFAAKTRIFFQEHLHEDEEIRWVMEGAGYFDVRCEGEGEGQGQGQGEGWVRIRVEKDDLIILPAGIYHRFTPDEDNYIKAMRLFKDEPKWTPLNRSAEVDKNPFRQEYLRSLRGASIDASSPNDIPSANNGAAPKIEPQANRLIT